MLMLGVAWTSTAAAGAVALGQDPVPIAGPAFVQVVSDDGRLTLEVPVAAIPAGVAPSATVAHASVASVVAYELLPLDLSLPTPVMATWQLDPAGMPPAMAGELVWLGLATAVDPDGGPWEWLGDPHVDVVGGGYTMTGWLSRFGTVIVTLQDTRIRGPEAIWGPGYELPNKVPVSLDLALVTQSGATAAAGFSGDWRFGGGYPERIDVVQTMADPGALAATWQCRRTGATSLVSTFGVREAPHPAASGPGAPFGVVPALPPAEAVVSVTFPVSCGVQHPGTDS